MTSQMKAGSRGDPKIYTRIESLIVSGKNRSPRQILTKLEAELPRRLKNSKIPSIKTIERIMREHTILEESKLWDSSLYSASDAKLIMEMLPQIAIFTEGDTISFNESEADSILKVRKLAPDLGVRLVLFVSFLYRWYEQEEKPSDNVDMFLALAPWREDEPWRLAAYRKMVEASWIIEMTLLEFLEMDGPGDPFGKVFCVERSIKHYVEGNHSRPGDKQPRENP